MPQARWKSGLKALYSTRRTHRKRPPTHSNITISRQCRKLRAQPLRSRHRRDMGSPRLTLKRIRIRPYANPLTPEPLDLKDAWPSRSLHSLLLSATCEKRISLRRPTPRTPPSKTEDEAPASKISHFADSR